MIILFAFITSISRIKHCDSLDLDLHISGDYVISDDHKTATFMRATCPIVENSKKQPYEQCEEYKYLRCIDSGNCDLCSLFPKEITL